MGSIKRSEGEFRAVVGDLDQVRFRPQVDAGAGRASDIKEGFRRQGRVLFGNDKTARYKRLGFVTANGLQLTAYCCLDGGLAP